jgi:hypothetical protein
MEIRAAAAPIAGTPASRARVSIRRARAGFVAKVTCSGTPAWARRCGSSAHERGQVWNNGGDTAALRRSSGKTIDTYKYRQANGTTYC